MEYTSYHSVDITSNIETLTPALGEPLFQDLNAVDDKVQIEYEIKLPNGKEIYLYSWKEYRRLNKSSYIDFHIGARSRQESLEARDYINSLIAKSRNPKQ
tara:strand:- start:124 stop:423 length:300 start_codon:yes stop_codon:yes gene_type:complete